MQGITAAGKGVPPFRSSSDSNSNSTGIGSSRSSVGSHGLPSVDMPQQQESSQQQLVSNLSSSRPGNLQPLSNLLSSLLYGDSMSEEEHKDAFCGGLACAVAPPLHLVNACHVKTGFWAEILLIAVTYLPYTQCFEEQSVTYLTED
jgi:hypothetical protein